MVASLQVYSPGIGPHSRISCTSGMNSIERETELFKVKTRPFLSKYDNNCSHPECGELFYAGETLIVGAQKWTNGEFKSNFGGSLYWICAKHSSSTLLKEEPRQASEKGYNGEEGPKLMIEPSAGFSLRDVEDENEDEELLSELSDLSEEDEPNPESKDQVSYFNHVNTKKQKFTSLLNLSSPMKRRDSPNQVEFAAGAGAHKEEAKSCPSGSTPLTGLSKFVRFNIIPVSIFV